MTKDFTETENKIRELVPRLIESFKEEKLEWAYRFRMHKQMSDEEVLNFLDCYKSPIMLEDVLEAIQKKRGEFHEFDLVLMWEFGKPFSGQSQETKEFIAQLLK